jgi:hypothetical protein
MKKDKLRIFIAILTIISLFSFAAVCNQCATTTEEEKTDIGEEDEATEEETTEEESIESEEETTEEETDIGEEETEEEEEAEEEEVAEEDMVKPTIELKVYEGPLYSSADDVCYWRVKAIVDGVPTPTVEFNRDDSSGAWGSKKAQINLNDPGDTFTLNATATNPKGTATDSIYLSWECNRPPEITDIVMMGDHFVGVTYTMSVSASDPDGDTLSYNWSVDGGSLSSTTGNAVDWTMPATAGDYQITVEADDGNGGNDQKTETVTVTNLPVLSMNVPIALGEGGYIVSDMINTNCYVTDWGYLVGDGADNRTGKGFISFDISGLAGSTIKSATLTFNIPYVIGDPSSFTPLWVSSTYWGKESIGSGDYNINSDPIENFNTSSFTCNDSKLKIYLQNAITNGKERFQVVIFFTGMATDNDNNQDTWRYTMESVDLDVTYTP